MGLIRGVWRYGVLIIQRWMLMADCRMPMVAMI